MASNNVSYSSMELVMHNSDLLREIFHWLPAKSLMKFQSVCKKWLSLISPLVSSLEFRQLHTVRCLKLQQQSLILQNAGRPRHQQWFHLNPSSQRLTSLTLSLPNDEEYIILQSSNGLLLLMPYDCLGSEDYYLYVHNPATKQSRKIIIPTRPATHPVADVALAFDPSKSPYYKLVNLVEATHWVEVYSSKSHTWEELLLEPFTLPTSFGLPFGFCFLNRPRVYWNNTIYWSDSTIPFCFCFDIAKLEMKTLDYPATQGKEAYYWNLQESNGHLYHVKLMGSEGGRETVEVWELDGRHRWHLVRQHHVPPEAPPLWLAWVQPTILTFLVDTCSLLICQNGSMRIYNLNFGSYEDFPDATSQPFFSGPSYLADFQFEGTLALV